MHCVHVYVLANIPAGVTSMEPEPEPEPEDGTACTTRGSSGVALGAAVNDAVASAVMSASHRNGV